MCSVQFSRSVVSDSLRHHELQHARLPVHHSSWSPPKPMSVELVMPSNHVICCCPLLLLPSMLPSIRVFSNESALCIRWTKYWSFSFNISPSNEHPGLISFRMFRLDLLTVKLGLWRVFSSTTVQKYHFFCAQLSLCYCYLIVLAIVFPWLYFPLRSQYPKGFRANLE